jgi:hypothetical protein
LQDADVAPTKRTVDAVKQLQKNLQTLEDEWNPIKEKLR